MKVRLVSYTPDPEMTVAVAARRCYSALGSCELTCGLSPPEEARSLSRLFWRQDTFLLLNMLLLPLLLKGKQVIESSTCAP